MDTGRSKIQISARLKMVDEHIHLENKHDLDGIMGTFGETARYDDEPWNEHHTGHHGVRGFYTELLSAMPDLHIEVSYRHASDEAVVLEAVITGRHLGVWRGLPPTGRSVEFPLCAIFTFDEADQLAGEKIYYDRATILRQLGMFHEPQRALGRINAIVMHPITIARVLGRRILRHGLRGDS